MSPIRRVPPLPRIYQVNSELFNAASLAKVPTHQLFTKLGLVHHPKPGLVHWLPIGMSILRKLQELVHTQMKNAGSEQVSLSALSHASLWQESGRWSGTELFKLKDFSQADYCLAPTCEEEITTLVKGQVSTYKAFPISVYQINTKFRDEKRPRSGLLRGREFIMKDAYTFDRTQEEAMHSYNTMVDAYRKVFQQLKVPYVMADADSGDIGGSLSHEWHYVHASGEDTLFTCSNCGESSNIERTLSFPAEEEQHSDVSVSYYTTHDTSTLVCAYYPSSRDHQANFLKEEIPDIDLSGKYTQEQILDLFRDEEALISKKIVRVMDSRLNSRSNFPDFPINFINRSLITTLTDIPIVSAEEGEICFKCEDGNLESRRAIEVGHTFYLGDKYTKTFDFTVEHPAEDGKLQKNHVLMGCYGIGISRIIAAIAEINRDEHGLRWPACIAPWQVTVVNNTKEEAIGEKVLDHLLHHGIDCRVDDRPKVRMGKKIKDSNMFGIPLVVIVGKNYPKVEIEVRGIHQGESGESSSGSNGLVSSKPEWEVEYGSNGVPVKYTVDVSEVGLAAKSILAKL
ncbi:hypothetical protein JCM33374_g477 [Metschnikowia sp. JCM 33374]|nr:hypothetical protein JCM33374_g477 [Metschnikowia sp. JCM 33374]